VFSGKKVWRHLMQKTRLLKIVFHNNVEQMFRLLLASLTGKFYKIIKG
jgi:hypothetical protein